MVSMKGGRFRERAKFCQPDGHSLDESRRPGRLALILLFICAIYGAATFCLESLLKHHLNLDQARSLISITTDISAEGGSSILVGLGW